MATDINISINEGFFTLPDAKTVDELTNQSETVNVPKKLEVNFENWFGQVFLATSTEVPKIFFMSNNTSGLTVEIRKATVTGSGSEQIFTPGALVSSSTHTLGSDLSPFNQVDVGITINNNQPQWFYWTLPSVLLTVGDFYIVIFKTISSSANPDIYYSLNYRQAIFPVIIGYRANEGTWSNSFVPTPASGSVRSGSLCLGILGGDLESTTFDSGSSTIGGRVSSRRGYPVFIYVENTPSQAGPAGSVTVDFSQIEPDNPSIDGTSEETNQAMMRWYHFASGFLPTTTELNLIKNNSNPELSSGKNFVVFYQPDRLSPLADPFFPESEITLLSEPIGLVPLYEGFLETEVNRTSITDNTNRNNLDYWSVFQEPKSLRLNSLNQRLHKNNAINAEDSSVNPSYVDFSIEKPGGEFEVLTKLEISSGSDESELRGFDRVLLFRNHFWAIYRKIESASIDDAEDIFIAHKDDLNTWVRKDGNIMDSPDETIQGDSPPPFDKTYGVSDSIIKETTFGETLFVIFESLGDSTRTSPVSQNSAKFNVAYVAEDVDTSASTFNWYAMDLGNEDGNLTEENPEDGSLPQYNRFISPNFGNKIYVTAGNDSTTFSIWSLDLSFDLSTSSAVNIPWRKVSHNMQGNGISYVLNDGNVTYLGVRAANTAIGRIYRTSDFKNFELLFDSTKIDGNYNTTQSLSPLEVLENGDFVDFETPWSGNWDIDLINNQAYYTGTKTLSQTQTLSSATQYVVKYDLKFEDSVGIGSTILTNGDFSSDPFSGNWEVNTSFSTETWDSSNKNIDISTTTSWVLGQEGLSISTSTNYTVTYEIVNFYNPLNSPIEMTFISYLKDTNTTDGSIAPDVPSSENTVIVFPTGNSGPYTITQNISIGATAPSGNVFKIKCSPKKAIPSGFSIITTLDNIYVFDESDLSTLTFNLNLGGTAGTTRNSNSFDTEELFNFKTFSEIITTSGSPTTTISLNGGGAGTIKNISIRELQTIDTNQYANTPVFLKKSGRILHAWISSDYSIDTGAGSSFSTSTEVSWHVGIDIISKEVKVLRKFPILDTGDSFYRTSSDNEQPIENLNIFRQSKEIRRFVGGQSFGTKVCLFGYSNLTYTNLVPVGSLSGTVQWLLYDDRTLNQAFNFYNQKNISDFSVDGNPVFKLKEEFNGKKFGVYNGKTLSKIEYRETDSIFKNYPGISVDKTSERLQPYCACISSATSYSGTSFTTDPFTFNSLYFPQVLSVFDAESFKEDRIVEGFVNAGIGYLILRPGTVYKTYGVKQLPENWGSNTSDRYKLDFNCHELVGNLHEIMEVPDEDDFMIRVSKVGDLIFFTTLAHQNVTLNSSNNLRSIAVLNTGRNKSQAISFKYKLNQLENNLTQEEKDLFLDPNTSETSLRLIGARTIEELFDSQKSFNFSLSQELNDDFSKSNWVRKIFQTDQEFNFYRLESNNLNVEEDTFKTTEVISQGDFASVSSWSLGGWQHETSLDLVYLTGAGGIEGNLEQVIPVVNGNEYILKYTVTLSDETGISTITPFFGSQPGITRSTTGESGGTLVDQVFTEAFIADITGNITLKFSGRTSDTTAAINLDDVSVTVRNSTGWRITDPVNAGILVKSLKFSDINLSGPMEVTGEKRVIINGVTDGFVQTQTGESLLTEPDDILLNANGAILPPDGEIIIDFGKAIYLSEFSFDAKFSIFNSQQPDLSIFEFYYIPAIKKEGISDEIINENDWISLNRDFYFDANMDSDQIVVDGLGLFIRSLRVVLRSGISLRISNFSAKSFTGPSTQFTSSGTVNSPDLIIVDDLVGILENDPNQPKSFANYLRNNSSVIVDLGTDVPLTKISMRAFSGGSSTRTIAIDVKSSSDLTYENIHTQNLQDYRYSLVNWLGRKKEKSREVEISFIDDFESLNLDDFIVDHNTDFTSLVENSGLAGKDFRPNVFKNQSLTISSSEQESITSELGSELIQNGNFTIGTPDNFWVKNSWSFGSNGAFLNGNLVSPITQEIANITQGKQYELKYNIVTINSSSEENSKVIPTFGNFTGVERNTSGSFTEILTANQSGNVILSINGNSTGSGIFINNISLKEIVSVNKNTIRVNSQMDEDGPFAADVLNNSLGIIEDNINADFPMRNVRYVKVTLKNQISGDPPVRINGLKLFTPLVNEDGEFVFPRSEVNWTIKLRVAATT